MQRSLPSSGSVSLTLTFSAPVSSLGRVFPLEGTGCVPEERVTVEPTSLSSGAIGPCF